MKKWGAACLLFWLLASPLLSKSVLLLYDGQAEKSEAYKSARDIYNVIGHFSVSAKQMLPLSEYRQNLGSNKDYTFIICEDGDTVIPDSLLKSLQETDGTIVWIHLHIQKLLGSSDNYWGLSYSGGEHRDDWSIQYKGKHFRKEDSWLNKIKISKEKSIQVYSTISDGRGNTFPYALKSKNLWYIADSPFSYAENNGRYLILYDLLHDIFEELPQTGRNALIRLEDINPESDPSSLKKTIDYLHKENVPFQISLVPIFRDPENQYETTLSDSPELVDMIQYGVSRGGTVILHGVTHQHRGKSCMDFEFWNDIEGKPISQSTSEWMESRLNAGLSECFKNNIYPLAWETPHYCASQSDYIKIGEFFDTFNDRIMVDEQDATQQVFPYVVTLKEIGVKVIPENLGYVDITDPDPDAIIKNAEKMRVVRDGTASFFFHPFVPLKHLKKIIKSMKQMGWKFVSIREFGCNLRTESVWVSSTGGKGTVLAANQYIRERRTGKSHSKDKEKISFSRIKGPVHKNIQMERGSLYVLECLDLLPEKRKSLLNKAILWFKKTLRKKPEKNPLHFSRTLVIEQDTSRPEELFDQESFFSVLKVFGFYPEIKKIGDLSLLNLSSYNLLVVPNAAALALENSEINQILGFVEQGGSLVTDSRSLLAERLGIRFSDKRIQVSEVQELSLPSENLYWNPSITLDEFSADNSVFLCKDAWSDAPVALFKSFREGKLIYLGPLFDPHTPFGISRFPNFPHYLTNHLDLSFLIRRNTIEYYFDPGFHQETSWEKLVRQWKESGVKIIYLAAWHFYQNYQFDYEYFIHLCHNYGIAVYAWFEFPQVSPLFWDSHPEWREKTATGEDARCHWRLLMNLFNTEAREDVRKFLWNVLTAYDWDGINLAELNFDTNNGVRDPSKFTPMNQDIQQRFQKKAGFNPLDLFNPASHYYWETNPNALDRFLQFREELVLGLHVFFLTEIEKIKKTKHKEMETIVTAMDSILHKEIREECGINTLDIIELMDRFPFTLQVEDPSRSWTSSPSRYLSYFNVYKKLIKNRQRLMFDINIIPNRDISKSHLSTSAPRGTEIATLLYYGTIPSGRAGIYSEHTIHPLDMDLLPFVTGSAVSIKPVQEGLLLESENPFSFYFKSPSHIPEINGKRWPFYKKPTISIPAGSHLLSFRKTNPTDLSHFTPRILFDADITELTTKGNAYYLEYNSLTPVSLTFSWPLQEIRLDSRKLPLNSKKEGLILPKGRHRLILKTAGRSSQIVKIAGYLSSHFFYIFGILSLLLLSVFYISSKVKK